MRSFPALVPLNNPTVKHRGKADDLGHPQEGLRNERFRKYVSCEPRRKRGRRGSWPLFGTLATLGTLLDYLKTSFCCADKTGFNLCRVFTTELLKKIAMRNLLFIQDC